MSCEKMNNTGFSIKSLAEKDKKNWEALVSVTPESGFMQSWPWSEFKETEGQKVLRVGVFENNRLIGGAIAYYVRSSLGSSSLHVPHGPVLPWKEPEKAALCMKLLKEEFAFIAKNINSPSLRIEPFVIGEFPEYIGRPIRAPLDLVPTPTLLIPIDKSDSEILSAMPSKGRYNIRLSQRKGVEIFSFNTPEAIEDFYPLFELTFSRHNFQGESRSFFENLVRCLGQSIARVYIAKYKGIAVSAAISIFYAERATYLYGGSLTFFNSSMASYALHWKMMQDARAAGCRIYDMYGIAPENEPYHPYAKFSRFKTRFGGNIVRVVGAHDIYFYPQLADMWAKSVESVL
ncbi:MAG: peptidoglycan bridge formation glycyltransferase FemA/FemB family protein [Candidatus Omnitrophica bacterium]|nr:peptidoglycan bridge formation glycyltransferase FemA/FemB family protein [Candidatus Omnitrophota bacterium]